ncbi:amino acid ABC transporter substrate-binding protein, PAAT family [Roseovarius nanhaiticus]|uniref:Amino acid ABC transporter substrate-binding protein, PAAT family n=1 Tax=Roseovarius nanhaiticus TaxID=573024 RepID=A0A1N7G958_9RHOB|nr:ABC transporter substrate-binding protein [Roseovarius nanhaiticus]SEK33723.1 amino acid ABC transporter substrate-binding protein, PAAT family [Roseovarius nanhaiticus]SIS09102.1 amino acid ABC transporter substrate-binding protein, PAAT family [Roseovarius nanhaiticus]
MFRRTLMTTAAAAALGLMALPVAAQDTLRIGVEGAYPPFSSKEADGTLVGFDIEIAQALCAEMQRECELVEQEWDGMIPALKARKFDAIVASMSITEERKRQIDFSDKYYQTPARIVAPKDADFEGTPEGLAGKRIGVQRGATHQCYAEKTFPDAEIVLYGTQEEVFRDLALGRIDVQLSDSMIAQEAFLAKEEGADYAFLGGDHNDLECYGEGVGIAVRQGEEELKQALSDAILAIREDGTYAQINDKYFPFDIYGARPEGR